MPADPTDRPDSSRPGLDQGLEAEIQAALGDMSVEDMLDFDDRGGGGGKGGRSGKGGDRETRTGTVVRVDREDVFVEFGPKSLGICPLSHFTEKPRTGERLEFIVERFDRNEGVLLLSRTGAVRKADWEALDVGQVVEARCTGVNKGGLEMEVANHKAFMPAGMVDIRHIEDLAVFVGEKMPCEVVELDRSRERIVLSRRAALEAERARTRDELMADLVEGVTMQGTVVSVRDFGAFVDLGGADGLVHISDLAYERVKHPSEVVKEGQTVSVKILKVDRSQDPPRIGLGMKQCLEDPYDQSAGELEVGAEVTGRVTRVTDFGAFLEISAGVEGLIHISELSDKRINRVSAVINEGEVVTVKIVSIDHERRRIGLSLKAMQNSESGDVEHHRENDPELRKLMAQLGNKFGDSLKGGIG
jgi:small subunit ribosomal protein S1